MTHQQLLRSLLAGILCAASIWQTQAAADVLDQIPDTALVYVVVNNMQQANREISAVAQQMGRPVPDLLQLVKERLGLAQGLADAGELAVVLVSRPVGNPFPVVFVRTDDYAALVSQLQPEAQGELVSRVKLAGQPALVAKKGDYAVLAAPMHSDELTQVIQSQRAVTRDEPTRAFTEQADVYAVATTAGVQLLVRQALAGLQAMKQNFGQMGPQGESVVAGLTIYEGLFQWAAEEVGQVALALHRDDTGAVFLRKRVEFRNPAPRTEEGTPADARQLLAHLPNWPYVMAGSGEFGDSTTMERWIALSMKMMRTTAGPQALTDAEVDKLVEVSRQSMKGVRSMAFTFGVPEGGGSLFSRTGIVIDVTDTDTFITGYLQAMQSMQEIFAENEQAPYRVQMAERVPIDDKQGLKIVMQVTPQTLGLAGEDFKQVYEKFFGEKGSLTLYGAPVDANRVALAYVSEERLREMLKATQTPDQTLGVDKGIQATARLLPATAQFVVFVSPGGLLQYVQQMLETVVPAAQRGQLPTIPPFPTSPPLGMAVQYDGQAVVAGLVVPAETLAALGRYIAAFGG
ncbi:MAG: hypothetical protein MUF48_08610 [Pirellulaceae bacterium]|jgi:hypothetical protein|nr:hypothetical protein [Pirellulaceae bacterium]